MRRLILANVFLLALMSIAGAQTNNVLRSKTDIDQAAEAINEATARGHIRFLADDLLEGRGPGSRGDQLTQLYLQTQFQTLGLQPAGPDGAWTQSVPLVGVTTHAPADVTFRSDERSLSLKTVDDFIANIGRPVDGTKIEDAQLVFVGYGIQAPEYDWDDFKGVDLRGKILLMMNNDPADDPDLFEGRRRLYYGRWDYKYESAAKQGALGAIIIHTTPSAGYPWQVVQTSWTGEEFELRGTDGPRMELKAWITDRAARELVQTSGSDLDSLRASAESRSFRPVPLNVSLSIELTADIREQDTANVLGMLEGGHPQLRHEVVVCMAHHDHIGLAAQRDIEGDNIYNGAVDNASGTASLLAMAESFTRLGSRPDRSILFAAVGAEEQGLLGSEWFAANPTVLPGNIAAVVNMDGTNVLGRTHDVNVIGLGKSNLDAIVEAVAKSQGRVVTPDQFPDRGYYYRSDQFSLAKIGVPGVYLHPGVRVIGKPEGWGKEQLERWVEEIYHQPSDEYSEDWDLSGAIEDTRLLFQVAYRISQMPELPAWNPGDEFEAARKRAIAQRPSR